MLTKDQIIKSINFQYGSFDRSRIRCPHDGGTCHHTCENDPDPSCIRENGGMCLSSPHEGYPIDSKEFFNKIIARRVLES